VKYLRLTILAAMALVAAFQAAPQDNRTGTTPSTPRRTIQDGPRDLLKETLRQAQKEAAEKDYAEMKVAASELATLSRQLSEEIDKGSEHVISIKVFDRIEKIEKLLKEIRSKAKDY
jgi:hypothetical protein